MNTMDETVRASLHKHHRTTLERVEKYISHNQFQDANFCGKLFPKSKQVDKLYHWSLPGGEAAWESWSFNQIIAQDFHPVAVGESFGPLWSTHWFKIEVTIPDSWVGQQVWLHWVSQAEAMLWSKDGEPLQGLSPGGVHLSPGGGDSGATSSKAESGLPDQSRVDYPISQCWSGSQDALVFYVEMACCNMFGGGASSMISAPDASRSFKVDAVEVSTRDADVYKLLIDLEVLHGLASSLPQHDPRGHLALYTANHIVNTVIKGEHSTASMVANSFFSKGNGAQAHTLALIGHCHIDTAWLWPYSESKRKCARSWTSTLSLMEEYPEMRFACSQAQQFAWVKSHYPAVFKKICHQVEAGRFIPVGGTWVEMDGLIPSGESFMRQFLYGQLFFQEEFGVKCKEFWLPDTFGYSAQFPQICKNFGITRFLTQKLSWNMFNKFPHHNFLWEGLDGSTILAHFPPGDSYEMSIKVKEALRTVTNLQDKGRVSTSAFLYGYGDGGGGPTREMLERSRRLRDTDGCPRMEHMSPCSFFQRLEAEMQNMCRWVGELYLELHNGTYTSQAETKRLNRSCEFALRDAEMLLTLVAVKGRMKERELLMLQDDLVVAWKKVLLNQFHDVIPGTSIGLVYRDSKKLYEEVLACAGEVKKVCLAQLFQETGDTEEMALVNTLPWEVCKVLEVDNETYKSSKKYSHSKGVVQSTESGHHYMAVQVPGIGWTKPSPVNLPPVKISINNNLFIMENMYIRAEINKQGQVESLTTVDNPSQNVFKKLRAPQGRGNQMVLHEDIPLFWDAWDAMDYHLETGKVLNDRESGCVLTEVKVVESGPLMVKLEWGLQISEQSCLFQEIELSASSPYLTFKSRVDWHENRKFLKVLFDTALLARTATFDSQFGFIERPTHSNTSWESAKFEVCGHKWADLSEHDFGVAVLNDSKYGWSARGSTLSLSLLRSPKAPDAFCDMGNHIFSYALMPHVGCIQSSGVQRHAYEFNNSLILSPSKVCGDGEVWFSLVGNGAMIETVKLAEDRSGDVVVRVYETHGGSSRVRLMLPLPLGPKRASLCCGLEVPQQDLTLSVDESNKLNYLELGLSPFKIVNVRISFS